MRTTLLAIWGFVSQSVRVRYGRPHPHYYQWERPADPVRGRCDQRHLW